MRICAFYMPSLTTDNITSDIKQRQYGCPERRRAIQSGLEYMKTLSQKCLILMCYSLRLTQQHSQLGLSSTGLTA